VELGQVKKEIESGLEYQKDVATYDIDQLEIT